MNMLLNKSLQKDEYVGRVRDKWVPHIESNSTKATYSPAGNSHASMLGQSNSTGRTHQKHHDDISHTTTSSNPLGPIPIEKWSHKNASSECKIYKNARYPSHVSGRIAR